MAWLPGHTNRGSDVEVLKAHNSPSALTTAAHMRVPPNNPPTVPYFATPLALAEFTRKLRRSAAEGNPLQSGPSAIASRLPPRRITTKFAFKDFLLRLS